VILIVAREIMPLDEKKRSKLGKVHLFLTSTVLFLGSKYKHALAVFPNKGNINNKKNPVQPV